jgi:hypothetical protein
MSSRSKSWGMIYESAREAIVEGSTVLDGKSCTETAWELMRWHEEFDKDYVVVVFAGQENGNGHDGETVAIYEHKIDVFSYKDFVGLYEERFDRWLAEPWSAEKPDFRDYK